MSQLNLLGAEPQSGAVISPCGLYRYRLWRHWSEGNRTVAWVMLNPSTADATTDDPTIRKCIGFTGRWGYDGLAVVNLFAYRATCPLVLPKVRDPFGPDNDQHLLEVCREAELVVCAWGRDGRLYERGLAVRALLATAGILTHYLHLTNDGQPGHPLYLRGDLKPQVWTC